jgi:hypothetical protein
LNPEFEILDHRRARELFERQAAWQKGRAALTWSEKIRMAEAVREGVVKLRRTRPPVADSASASKEPGAGKTQASRSE